MIRFSLPRHTTSIYAIAAARAGELRHRCRSMGSDDRQGVLWSLRARRSIAKCVLRVDVMGTTATELLVLQDDEIAFREAFPDEHTARVRASALYDRLVRRGWKEAS